LLLNCTKNVAEQGKYRGLEDFQKRFIKTETTKKERKKKIILQLKYMQQIFYY
jgi:hypothetical protein